MKEINKIKDELIKRHKEKNPNDEMFEKQANDIKDPFFSEFEIEINEFINKDKKIENSVISNNEIEDLLNVNEKQEEIKSKEELTIRENVIERINKILNIIDLNLYKNVKVELVKIIIKDIIEKYGLEVNIQNIKHIEKTVSDEVDNKYNHFFNDKENRLKTMLYNILNKILPEVDNFYKTNSKNKLSKMSLLQKKNLIKFFLISINKKYLNDFRFNNKLSLEEYELIKEKVRLFVIHKYDKTLEGE